MYKRTVSWIIPTLIMMVACQSGASPDKPDTEPGVYQANWESLQKIPVPQWFDDDKFGIFIHWGPLAAGEEKTAPANAGFKDLIPLFKAEKWDPEDWATLFKEAGAHYVILTGEHHDGWVQWDSKLTEWTSVKMGPKRDLVGDLATAVRQQGMRFAPSYHRERHNGYFATRETRFLVDPTPRPEILKEIEEMPEAADLYGPFKLDDAYIADYVARWKEMEEKYQPDFMWLDDVPMFYHPDSAHPQALKYMDAFKGMIADYMNAASGWGKEVYLNNKGRTAPNWPLGIGCREWDRVMMDYISPAKWQCPLTMDSYWMYKRSEEEKDSYKSTAELLHILIDVVSKNGNLLLNVGPRADGTIPDGQRRRLQEMGEWLRINGEAIYGTRPWKEFGEDPPSFALDADGNETRQEYDYRNLRFTSRGDTLYALQLGWPDDRKMRIRSMAASSSLLNRQIREVALVGTGEPLEWKQTGDHLEVSLPASRHCEHALAVKITTQ